MEGLRAAEGKLLAAWLLLLLITACCGQGLPNDGKGSAKPAEPLEKSVDRAQQWKKQVGCWCMYCGSDNVKLDIQHAAAAVPFGCGSISCLAATWPAGPLQAQA